jgi:penicillin V acylase-like amidase (Ntn superfamily)
MMKSNYLTLCVGTVFAVLVLVAVDANSCTRIFWNINPDLIIVGRTEDYVTASHPTFVATPHGVKRWGMADKAKGWSGDVIPHLVKIDGDIYDQSIE